MGPVLNCLIFEQGLVRMRLRSLLHTKGIVFSPSYTLSIICKNELFNKATVSAHIVELSGL